MLLDETGEIAETWERVPDEADIPAEGAIIVPLARLEEAMGGRPASGVAIPNDADVRELVPLFPRIGLIAVDFPSFADGRGFSLGQRLRDLGFKAGLRAEGPVIADQFAYLLACGFDQVDVSEDVALRQPVEQWLAQLGKISLGYQRGRPTQSIPDQRRAYA
ncbi:MAG: DUF934 domain-containing protein [Pseudomonadota bacterium]